MAQVTEMESALRYAQETEERLQADKEELQRELQEAVASLRGVRSLPLPYVSSCGDVTSPTHCNGATMSPAGTRGWTYVDEAPSLVTMGSVDGPPTQDAGLLCARGRMGWPLEQRRLLQRSYV